VYPLIGEYDAAACFLLAKQSNPAVVKLRAWVASSQVLLAMTDGDAACIPEVGAPTGTPQ
jgi:hypothetical protein